MDIYIQFINSRIVKMSKRRQKIAMAKQKKMMLTNCYPIYVHEPVQFDTSFRYISYLTI